MSRRKKCNTSCFALAVKVIIMLKFATGYHWLYHENSSSRMMQRMNLKGVLPFSKECPSESETLWSVIILGAATGTVWQCRFGAVTCRWTGAVGCRGPGVGPLRATRGSL